MLFPVLKSLVGDPRPDVLSHSRTPLIPCGMMILTLGASESGFACRSLSLKSMRASVLRSVQFSLWFLVALARVGRVLGA